MAVPQIIILNGTSSAGKSSTAKALQKIVDNYFLHVAFDAFLEMFPHRLWKNPDGISFEQSEGPDGPSVTVELGPVALRALSGMRSAVGALAREGNYLIVDDLMLSAHDQQDYRNFLQGLDFRFVGLVAPLDVLEERERQRGDRMLGLARWQFDRVHKDISYDLTIDTSLKSPDESARIIASIFELAI
jgi:chloramphenicol 3-O phosphotransferase